MSWSWGLTEVIKLNNSCSLVGVHPFKSIRFLKLRPHISYELILCGYFSTSISHNTIKLIYRCTCCHLCPPIIDIGSPEFLLANWMWKWVACERMESHPSRRSGMSTGTRKCAHCTPHNISSLCSHNCAWSHKFGRPLCQWYPAHRSTSDRYITVSRTCRSSSKCTCFSHAFQSHRTSLVPETMLKKHFQLCADDGIVTPQRA